MFEGAALSKYLGILGTLVIAGFGFPIPEEIPIVTAGAFVGHDSTEEHNRELVGAIAGGPASHLLPAPTGLTKWYIMLPLCIFGVVFGDCVLFFAGRWFGPWLLSRPWVQKRLLTPAKRAQIEANFEKRGVMILLGARLTPGIRTPVFIMAGVLRMPISRFLLADSLYAIPGVNLLFWLAYWFTDQFVETIKAVDKHRPLAIMVVVAAICGVVLFKVLANRRVSTGDVDEIPIYAKPVGAVANAVERTIEKTVGKTVGGAAYVLEKVKHPLGGGHQPPAEKPPEVPATAGADKPAMPG